MTADAQVQGLSQGLAKPRTRLPAVVAPTVALFGGALALWAWATWLSLVWHLPAWSTVPLHTLAVFGLFTVLHEAAHHAAGSVTWLNGALGRLTVPFVSPFGGFPAARYVHLTQHRSGSPEHLTPWNTRGPSWTLPLRWATVDLWHAWRYLSTPGRPTAESAEMLAVLVFLPCVLAAVAGTGHGWELTVVYLLPQRLALVLVSWCHDWLPRRRASGYHQVHAARPGQPFYRFAAVPAPRVSSRSAVAAEAPSEFHPLTVTGVRWLTGEAVAVNLAVPAELRQVFRFEPGQHLVLRALVQGEQVERSYAICASQDEPELRVAIKRVPGGRFSEYALGLRLGDRVLARPPSGRFGLPAAAREARHVVAVAAGSGIVPVLPVVVHALATSPRTRVTLLYVNRSGDDTLFADDLSEYTRRFEGRLRVMHYRTDERDPSLRHARGAKPFDSIGQALAISYERYLPGGLDTGRIRSLLESRLHPSKVDEWLLCAPPEVAEPVREALAEHDVPDGAVHVEHFHRGRR
ncbi:fatty acid desaturase [Amycolatopsis endophytica]|uniref:Ring-1,2-phenylacetyl-CoA epoxidase subunit PaaE n=1 Tax=Amycolatopsis endophytica TaxID=860233 RepID=A0A853AVU6_9PSEU|nr:FAD-binding oxidoreductase [Amycolatopsis endophytica]NYI86768.1 ring-1,2-phenylacetyl-CoA epoxidase subunit PaaE [Amycolatopsis endophytica]